MFVRTKKEYALGPKRPLYRVLATTKHMYKVTRASLKKPKSYQRYWIPKYYFTKIGN